ncbi:MAG TPA: hypothetical protein DCQ50_04020 [Chryseobacterium sp.]|nr:hypothetical protein [Chryseobacterium sp.]
MVEFHLLFVLKYKLCDFLSQKSFFVVNNFTVKMKNYIPQNYSNKMVYKNCSFAKVILSIRLKEL